ncbi:uncharacterized protein LOC122082426 [Macadamia integrifolia]|uniref:uncharacterized protein LOC122082426 n=1 Tax=Macadamia integrifolia TaxID=60698 RepID=UPI001C4F33C8|nr:uncharacterized protein LOC122082426 [Macadamia integrifolia]
MRCKRHPSDPSSGVGICASCLRERLFAIIAAQARQQALAQAQEQAQAEAEDCRKFNGRAPPPLVFPRSVSPYIYSRSASDPSGEYLHHHNKFDRHFYSTPQVDPTSTNTTIGGAAPKKKRTKFSLFANLFRKFRSEESDPDGSGTDARTSRVSRSSLTTSSSSSPISQTSFSALFPGGRKKLSRLFTFEDTRSRIQRPLARRDRGMSPEKDTVEGDLSGDYDSTSSYSSKSSPKVLQAQPTPPQATPSRARRRGHHSRNVSGLAVCFSPLVRPSPSRHHRNTAYSSEIGFSGEVRTSSKPNFLTAPPPFCKNRSRKLADIGRIKLCFSLYIKIQDLKMENGKNGARASWV